MMILFNELKKKSAAKPADFFVTTKTFINKVVI